MLIRNVVLATLFLASTFGSHPAAARFNVVYSFCSLNACRDGFGPLGLAADQSGNLFGISQKGGGEVYELVGGTRFKRLYLFCPFKDCTVTGSFPRGRLVVDAAGNVYGTTIQGGAHNHGTFFELSPSAGGNGWTFHLLYSFCSQGGSACTDGDGPSLSAGLTYVGQDSGLPYDGVSPLYGTGSGGGSQNGGVVFKLLPSSGSWSETVLYSFCAVGGAACRDGAGPNSLIADSSGKLFGVAAAGGQNLGGVVFELDTQSSTESVLYNFCSQTNCADGQFPLGLLARDGSGDIFGVTGDGGRSCRNAGLVGHTCGVVYKLSPTIGSWQETVLHTFCAAADCKDGAVPDGGLLMDSSGNLFGTTIYGGGNDAENGGTGAGVLFELSGSSYTVRHRFCSLGGSACTDGAFPSDALAMDSSGRLFGTTQSGGANGGNGEVFRFKR